MAENKVDPRRKYDFRPSLLAQFAVEKELDRHLGRTNALDTPRLAKDILHALHFLSFETRGEAADCRCPICEGMRAHLGTLQRVREDLFAEDLGDREHREAPRDLESRIAAALNAGCLGRPRDATLEYGSVSP